MLVSVGWRLKEGGEHVIINSCIYRGQSVHCITVAEEGPRTEKTFYAVVSANYYVHLLNNKLSNLVMAT